FSTDIRATTHNVAEITRLMAEEDGTVRRLFADPKMADAVQGTLESTQGSMAELNRSMRAVRAILNEVQNGDGLAHELVYSEDGGKLVDNLAEATGEVASLLREVRTGDGLAHDILYENQAEELMDNATAVSADLRAITGEIRAGRGTIGGLLMDPSIYED